MRGMFRCTVPPNAELRTVNGEIDRLPLRIVGKKEKTEYKSEDENDWGARRIRDGRKRALKSPPEAER
jgi:hypothetical protein